MGESNEVRMVAIRRDVNTRLPQFVSACLNGSVDTVSLNVNAFAADTPEDEIARAGAGGHLIG